jgi:glycerol-3-phosphate dehydrogenase (NAD(P)+)
MSVITILGAGAFGSALAVSLAQKHPVRIWGRNLVGRESARLPGVLFGDQITVCRELPQIDPSASVLVAVPMQELHSFLSRNAAILDGCTIVACCKGLDLETGLGPVATIAANCPSATPAILTGPSFANDIAAGLPTALTISCADRAVGIALRDALSTPNLRLYSTTDVTGAELGGALKNVIAIAAGIAIGAGLGESARAAVMTRGYAEMVRLAVHLGARAETLAGLSGFGDLVLTCTSVQSRNFRHGLALGEGRSPDPVATVEGIPTSQAAFALATRSGMEMPLSAMVAALTSGRIGLQDGITTLLSRPLKSE